jgi:hypothetical protein
MPNTGVLGIHFKLVQSIESPSEKVDLHPNAFFSADGTGIFVSSITEMSDTEAHKANKKYHALPTVRPAIKLLRYNGVSGNELDTLGTFPERTGYCVSPDSRTENDYDEIRAVNISSDGTLIAMLNKAG